MQLTNRVLTALVLTMVAACGLAPLTSGGTEFVVQTLFLFGPPLDFPDGPLVDAGDGRFYGLGSHQSESDSVFEVTTNGGFRIIYRSIAWASGLMMGKDGNLYGTTANSVYELTRDGLLTTLVTFDGTNGLNPLSTLLTTSNGDIYGTTLGGGPGSNTNGSQGFGTVFKLVPQGTNRTVVAFNGTNGAHPVGHLVQCSDGRIYGLTQAGGQGFQEKDIYSGFGTIFRVSPTGEFRTLINFAGTNGCLPQDLVLANDGALYAVTAYGGKGFDVTNPHSGFGTILKLDLDGSVLGSAQFDATNGIGSSVNLVLGGNGQIYGTTAGGQGFDGVNPWSGFGSVFAVASDGSVRTLVTFNGFNGVRPESRLVEGTDGSLYGATTTGGLGFDGTNSWSGFGTIFKLTPDGSFKPLVRFDGTNGSHPYYLTPASDGNIYGTTDETLFRITPDGKLTTLHWFADNEGYSPEGGLVQGTNGAFYGTAREGGMAPEDTQSGNGTIFSITPDGSFTRLFSFPSSGTSGVFPSATLLLAGDGNLYGTTLGGGQFDWGTAFKLAPNGMLTTLLAFGGTNGSAPSRLVQGKDGNFYGTTQWGGIGGTGGGTVFKLTPDGALTTLVSFNGGNGSSPGGGLVLGTDGNFYGTTTSADTGPGSIFRVTPGGEFRQLHVLVEDDNHGDYSRAPEGDAPFSELVQGSDGDFYGVTAHGGKFGFGTVFKVTTNGALTSLASFDGTNGAVPWVGLAKGNDGNFYGATFMGGQGFTGGGGDGTVFEVTSSGGLTTLASFPGRAYFLHDSPPYGVGAGNLVQGVDGNIYGVRSAQVQLDSAGNFAGFAGTIFRLVPRPEITTISRPGNRVTLTWSAFPGGTYRVESSPSLSAPAWSPVTTNVIATGSTASATAEITGGTQRLYRVRLLP